MLEQHFDFGGKSEEPAVPKVVEGFYAKAIAHAEKLFSVLIPNGVRKHAAIARYGLIAPLFVGMDAGFGIAMTLIAMSRGFEFGTNVGVIEDLAVVGNPQRVVFIAHRLAAGREIDDAQAAMTDCYLSLHVEAVGVRSAVGDDIRHSADEPRIGRCAVSVNEACDAAHISVLADSYRLESAAGWNQSGNILGGGSGAIVGVLLPLEFIMITLE